VAAGRRQHAGRLAWLMLIVAVVFGVGLMHTLGHPVAGDFHACHHATPATESGTGSGGDAGDGCGGGIDPLSICLAVLAGLGLVAGGMGVLRLAGGSAVRFARRRRAAVYAPVRAPPRLVGLAVTRVAVLRT
jgi:hypothetical protein